MQATFVISMPLKDMLKYHSPLQIIRKYSQHFKSTVYQRCCSIRANGPLSWCIIVNHMISILVYLTWTTFLTVAVYTYIHTLYNCIETHCNEKERKHLHDMFIKNNYPINFICKHSNTKKKSKENSNQSPQENKATFPYIHSNSEMTAQILCKYKIAMYFTKHKDKVTTMWLYTKLHQQNFQKGQNTSDRTQKCHQRIWSKINPSKPCW